MTPWLLAWNAAFCLLCILFRVFDWGHGVARAVLLVLMAALAWWWRNGSRAWPGKVSRSWVKPVTALVVVGTVANLVLGTYRIVESRATGTLPSDQSQTVLAALRLARKGVNPWATSTFTDGVAYDLAIDELRKRPTCGSVPSDRSIPRITDSDDCARVGGLFSALGFKYGPAMLAFYAPFVALFGAAGMALAHVALFAALVLTLWAWGSYARLPRVVVLVALLPTLYSTQLTWNVLMQGHLDLFPVLLCLGSLWCIKRSAYGTAAVMLGISLGAKFLPGLLFVPLLLKAPRRYTAIALGVALACFAPLVVPDWRGFWLNMSYPFTRAADSTALMFFLGPVERNIVRGAAAALLLAAFVRAHQRQWTLEASVDWLVVSHLIVLGIGGTLHNNYLVWLLPLFALLTMTGRSRVDLSATCVKALA